MAGVLWLCAAVVLGAGSGGFGGELVSSSVGAGGVSAGGGYTLEGFVAPLGAGVMSGGGYTLEFGFAPVGAARGCDAVDFNGDGEFPDALDFDDFISVFSGGPCSTGACGDIDFNNDGVFPDEADIEAMLSVLSGGGCP
ncbi:MAG: hypothetical protein U0637_14005 [Phycisphaerales bacterium]